MPTVGLVLGAGGVVGHAWHAGVLAGLADGLGWDARHADIVVGTSAGSVVGALLRGGVSAADLYAGTVGAPLTPEGRAALAGAGRAATAGARAGGGAGPAGGPASGSSAGSITGPGGRWPRYTPASPTMVARGVLQPWRLRPGHFVAGLLPRGRQDTAGIGATARRLHGGGWPEQALWLCAVSLTDGRRTVFGRDAMAPVDPGLAVEASCAIPGWFAPVTVHGREYVDGGVHSPTNADVLAGCGLDLVVVSSPMSIDRTAARRPAIDRMVRVGHRMALQREVTVLRGERTGVVTLQPGLDDIAVLGPTSMSMDPEHRRAVAERARETTRRRIASERLADVLAPIRS